MFPEKVRRFVSELVQRTEAGELPWKYDYFDAVFCTAKDFSARLLYSQNSRQSCTQFVLVYRDAQDNLYDFRITSLADDADDYGLARQLFDTARASGMALPF
jgi:hypothetical protein